MIENDPVAARRSFYLIRLDYLFNTIYNTIKYISL